MKKAIILLLSLTATTASILAQDPYFTIGSQYRADTPQCMGQYSEHTLHLTLYSTELDQYGYALSAGDIVNLELYVPDDAIVGTYYCSDSQADGLIGGYMYEIMPQYFEPKGTSVMRYGEYLDESLALASAGSKVEVKSLGAGLYSIDYDICTDTDAHITGSWNGLLDDYVSGLQLTASAANLVVDTRNTVYYNLQGIPVDNPAYGKTYIKVDGSTSTKIVIR